MRETASESEFKEFFPYRPYPSQLQYARDVYNIVEEGRVGFLEAPTGFGKTVALLSATLPHPSRVFYYSRTHTQMRQVAYELERINSLGYELTGVVRGSRLQLCLDKELRGMGEYWRADEACLSRIRSEEEDMSLAEFSLHRTDVILSSWERLPLDVPLHCSLGGRTIEIVNHVPRGAPLIASVERLLEYGERTGICPYYLARALAQAYRVVIGAYNYLFLDPGFQGQVVIIDEAHNMEDFCKESRSYRLSKRTVERAIEEVKVVDRPWAADLEEFLVFLIRFFNHADFRGGELLQKDMVLEEMEKSGLTRERIKEFIEGWPLIINVQREFMIKKGRVVILDRMRVAQVHAFIEAFLSSGEMEYVGFWNTDEGKNPKLEWLCLDPRVALSEVLSERPRAVIFTSGTLSPMEGTAARLGTPEALKKSYPSIIPRDNIMILAVARGPNGRTLTTRYEAREDVETILEYGRAVAWIVRNIPNGTIVFFPSYQVMNHMLNTWNTYGLLGEVDAATFIEAQGSTASLMEAYKRTAKEDRAVLFAVVRGKLSEGANFPDESGRAVILVGIPFPNISDPKVMAQREYYERIEKGMGRKWYLDQSFQAVNQSLGRAWRHKNDFAVGILLDSRYSWRDARRRLSPWLAERTTYVDPRTPFKTVERMIKAFFK